MSNYITTSTELASIADAIRAKGGTSASMSYPDGFVSAIGAIPAGGGMEDEIITRTISGTYENSNITTIGSYAFAFCFNLLSVNFPACVTVSNCALSNCNNLETISFPLCEDIGYYAFANCYKLPTANFSVCTTIGSSAFVNCFQLTSVNFPACTDIKTYAFSGCSSITTMSFPVCTNIGNVAFSGCGSITTMSFPACTNIGTNAFRSCTQLISIYLMGSSVVTLNGSNAFSFTPIAGFTESTGGVYGSIYVPSSLLASYKETTNWTYFSDRFVGV